MHSAVALSTMCTCASPPSPASLPDAVSVLPDCDTVTECTACGFPASAAPAPSPTTSATADRMTVERKLNRKCRMSLSLLLRCLRGCRLGAHLHKLSLLSPDLPQE